MRVVVALIFLALSTLLFLNFEWMGETPLATAALYPQFVPSFLKFTQTLGWAATGFLVVLILTLLFGRIYCSMICPLGTLQDIVIRIAIKLRWPRRVKFLYQDPQNTLRYSILVVVTALLLGGITLGLSLTDPFANYGRIVGDLLRPLYIAAHNGFGRLLEVFGMYGPIPLQWKAPAPATWLFPIGFLAGIVWLSATRGRLFCNTLCPVGTLLGFISRFAVFKIRIPKQACIVCARCSIACKAGCIRLKTKEIDFSRCIACFNCITVCEAHGIGYASPQPVKFYKLPPSSLLPNSVPPSTVDKARIGERIVSNPARRTLLRGTALMMVASVSQRDSAAANPHNRVSTVVSTPKAWPVAPPGAGNLARFNDLCIACHLCVGACPYSVLQPAFLEYGWSGLLQAHMDYTGGYCRYECNRCGQVCPTGAIQPVDLATKQITQLGRAHFVRDNCIVYTDHITCGVCGDYCPTKALELKPYQDGLMMPTVHEQLCIGCGACENSCPTRPHRAVYVEGFPIQQWAERPLLESHSGGIG